jgi:hypothetical protein
MLLMTSAEHFVQGEPTDDEVQDTEAPVDWIMTSLMFLFPAVGGLLFGEYICISPVLYFVLGVTPKVDSLKEKCSQHSI